MDVALDSSLEQATINLKKDFIAIVIVKITIKNMLQTIFSSVYNIELQAALTKSEMLFFQGQPGSKQ
jgi:hypothetical protein